MPFSIAAAGIGAAGALGAASMQSSTAGKASGQAQRNLQLILPQMQQGYNQSVAGFQPYQAGGGASTSDMQDLLGLNGQPAADAAMARFQASPGYQYQLTQGLRAVDAGAASQGMLRSGATLKAEQTLGSNLANTDFGNYFNRLSGLAGQGLQAAGGIANANQSLVANEEGNAQSQNTAMIGGANAQNSIIGNTAQGIGNNLNNLFNNQAFLNAIGGAGTGSYGSSAPGTPGISASGNPVMTGFIGNQNIGTAQNPQIPPALPSY